MTYGLRFKGNKVEIVDNDGRVVAEGRLVADYVEGNAESLIRCSVAFEGIHKAQS